MATRKIIHDGDDILTKKSRTVTNFDKRLHTLLDDMEDTLHEAEGAGLAAPQVGVLRRVCIVEINENELIEMINPEIISREGEQDGPEGCLSLPGIAGMVKRPMCVTVRANDRHGKTFEVYGEGLKARALCHEIDHLDGIMYTEIMSRFLTDEEMENQ